MVMATIGTFLGGWALDVAKDKVGDAVDQRLSGDSIKEAIQQAVRVADGDVPELFAPYERQGLKGIDRFLNGAFREVAIAQLQKPLQDDGKPDDALLTQAFLREAKTHPRLKEIDERHVEDWMKAFTDAYFQTTNNFLSFQVTQAQYYRQLRSKTGKVVFSGMAVDGTVVDEPGELTRIFVMPDVQRQGEKGYELAKMPALDVAEDAQKRVLWEQQQQFLLRKERAAGTTPVSAVELLKSKDEKRVVILGAPGAGKTTLMNYWVVMATLEQAGAASGASSENGSSKNITSDALFGTGRCLPVLIRIRDLVREPDLSVLEFLIKFAKADLEVEEIPTDFFQHWLKRGDALILLDGLDEVADDAQRHKVVEKIETFLRAYEDCPAIITSRPAGYRDDYFSRKQYPHYELLPFDDEKIETFINYWYDSRVDSPPERERRKESLRDALAKKPRIKQLARNPLLLTMIALIHRYRTLPRQRHELYNCAVETLISTWDKEKELTTNSKLDYLTLPDIRRLMERLAYWVHAQGSVSDAENGTQIERGAIVKQLAKSIQAVKASEKLQWHQAKAEAITLLDKIVKDRAGLLSKQGENRYAFVHKTYQEYLCSQEILYLQEDQDPDDDNYVPYVKQHIKQYLHDPHWREVLLLLVAQQTPIPAKSSLKTILNAESEYEQWLHRDVLFAGSCLAENAEVSDQGIVDEILTELVSLETSAQLGLSRKLQGEIFRVIASFQGTPFASSMMKRLAAYQPHIEQQRMIEYQSRLNPNETMQKLLRLLKDNDPLVRTSTARSLGKIGHSSNSVVDGLMALLLNDEDPCARASACEALRALGQDDVTIMYEGIDVLPEEEEYLFVRPSAIRPLGALGQLFDTRIEALLDSLKDSSLSMNGNIIRRVSDRATQSLITLAQKSDTVKPALVEWIEQHQHEAYVGKGIDALWELTS